LLVAAMAAKFILRAKQAAGMDGISHHTSVNLFGENLLLPVLSWYAPLWFNSFFLDYELPHVTNSVINTRVFTCIVGTNCLATCTVGTKTQKSTQIEP
jgi:hypothetical protein